MHWLAKFWIVVALIPCLGALIGILLIESAATPSLNGWLRRVRTRPRLENKGKQHPFEENARSIDRAFRLQPADDAVKSRTEGKEGTDNVRNRNGNSNNDNAGRSCGPVSGLEF